jgi:hypothetical protein
VLAGTAPNYIIVGNNVHGINYFGLANYGNGSLFQSGSQNVTTTSAITVQQAYAIDGKIDDGMPMTGNVLAGLPSSVPYWGGPYLSGSPLWMNGPVTSPLAASSLSCFDNGGVNGASHHYSIEYANGNGTNCALVFKMQAGD